MGAGMICRSSAPVIASGGGSHAVELGLGQLDELAVDAGRAVAFLDMN
jgi:hypothetical protein